MSRSAGVLARSNVRTREVQWEWVASGNIASRCGRGRPHSGKKAICLAARNKAKAKRDSQTNDIHGQGWLIVREKADQIVAKSSGYLTNMFHSRPLENGFK